MSFDPENDTGSASAEDDGEEGEELAAAGPSHANPFSHSSSSQSQQPDGQGFADYSGRPVKYGAAEAMDTAAAPPPPDEFGELLVSSHEEIRRPRSRNGAQQQRQGGNGRPVVANINEQTFRNSGYADRVLSSLSTLRRSDQLCDVTLISGPSPEECAESEALELMGDADRIHIRAHRAVLAACCPYFCAMFTVEMTEARQSHVYIQGLNPDALALLVDYMYTAEISITEGNVQMLLPAASLLQLTEVRKACCDFLKAQLHPSNCLGIRAFADLHDCQELLQYSNTFTEQHFSEVTQCEEFLTLNSEELANLISSDRLTTPGEEKVFESVIQWVRYDPHKRKEELARLMEYVRLPLLPQEYLLGKVDSEPLIRENALCKDYLIEALKYHLMKTEQKVEFKSPRVKPRMPIGLPKLLLVIGGQAPKAIRNVDVYDFQTGKWSSVAELPQRRCRCGVALLSNQVYAVGGFNGSLRVRTVDVYDPGKDVWTPASSMEARRSTLGVAVLNGRVYAVGGFDGSTGLNSCEAFDPKSGEWQTVASMLTRRSSVGVGVLNGCLYAVGGYDGQSRQCLSTVEMYEPRMDRWTLATEMTTRRSGAGVAVIDDGGRSVMYAVGGHDGPMVKRSAEVYEPQLGHWRAISDMSHCRRNAGVVAVNGGLYAVGGDDGSANLSSVEVYESERNVWGPLETPPRAVVVSGDSASASPVLCPQQHQQRSNGGASSSRAAHTHNVAAPSVTACMDTPRSYAGVAVISKTIS